MNPLTRREVCKFCARAIRDRFCIRSGHAYELVAAFFGYKSYAALVADAWPNFAFPANEDATVEAIKRRRADLGLSSSTSTEDIAKVIAETAQRAEFSYHGSIRGL